MSIHKSVVAFGVALLLSTSVSAKAAGNVNVEADAMEIIDAQHQTIFRGNVVATRPTDKIQADEMVVTSTDIKQEDGSMKSTTQFVDASGNITIYAKNAVITGDKCRFDVLNDKLQVDGNVTLTQGTSVLRGPKLNINLKSNDIQMSGGSAGKAAGRVKAVLQP